MKRVPLPLFVLAAFVAAAACKSGPQPFPDTNEVAAAPVRIAFRPPLDRTLVERSVQTRSELAPTGGSATESVIATLESQFEQMPGGGYTLTQRVPTIQIEQNGAPIDSELAQLVTKFPMKVEVAKDGAFVQLLNAEEIEKVLRSAFTDPAQADAILQSLTPEALEAQARAEWNSKYGAFLGRDVEPGFAWYEMDSVATTGGEYPYLLERKIVGTRQGGEGRELVIALSCPASAEQAARPESAKQLLSARGNPALTPDMTCKGQQVVGVEPFAPISTALELSVTTDEGRKIVFSRDVQLRDQRRVDGAAAPADGGQ